MSTHRGQKPAFATGRFAVGFPTMHYTRQGTFDSDRGLAIDSATPGDLSAVVDVLLSSRREFIPYAPLVHTAADVEIWMKSLLAIDGCVTVARLNAVVVGVLVVSREDNLNWIDQLYLRPGHTGRGIGRELLAHALRLLGRAYPVRLYTFQANTGARRFYERAGFRTIALTDGAENEERCPDVLYELEALPIEVSGRI